MVTPPGLLPLALPDSSGPVPLSYAQEQMWALYELDRGSAAYSVPMVQWLGSMRPGLLHAAVGLLAGGQHSLRTRYGYGARAGPHLEQPGQWVVPARGKRWGDVWCGRPNAFQRGRITSTSPP